jgi:peptidylprolyl isomerase
MRIVTCFLFFCAALGLAGCGQSSTVADSGMSAGAVAATPPPAGDPANTMILELKTGKVVIRLRPDLAPKHVERVKMLVKEGFYNGLKFHRVIPGFMAQTGDPLGTGAGGSKYPDLPAEFTPTAFERGTIGAARTSDPNTANSQFFICFTHTPNLNGQYTVWGQVTEGMQFVDQIAKGEPPPKPDVIVKMYLAADAPH